MATLQQLGTVRLRLRLGGEDYQETLHAVQGDTGRVLEFDVLDGDGTVVTDLTGVTPVLFVRRPDGKEVGSATGEIVGGVIRITIPSSLLAYAGETKAQIQLVDSANQHKLHDHLYRLQIEESLEAGASPGENLWFSLAELTEAIEEVHLLVEQYDTDVAAVATMRDDVTTKHGEVTTMHTSLQDVYDTEQARRTAESARISAETKRQTAETKRANAESARGTAEDTRQTQETERQQAEAQRDTDEDTRVANEAIRQTNESIRESQETTRETQEGARQTLYQQLQALQEVLGTDPVVELGQAVTALQAKVDAAKLINDPIAITQGQDMNALQEPGFYKAPNSAIAVSLENSPTDVAFGMMILDNLPCTQMVFEYGNGNTRVFIRELYGFADTWSAWRELKLINDPIEITQGQDMNALQEPGFYKAPNSAIAVSLENSPTDVAFGMMILDNLPCTQMVFEYGNENTSVFIRELYGFADTWSAWREFLFKSNADAYYLSKTAQAADSAKLGGQLPAHYLYTHPSTHPASMITQDSARRMVSDTQITAWTNKVDKSGGQMTGALMAKSSGDTRQMRNITIGTTAPTSTTGHTEGDIWLVVP